jgi:hypothetical protein
MINHVKDLLRFLFEEEPGLKELEILCLFSIKYLNNANVQPATYKDIILLIRHRIDGNLAGHSPESIDRVVRRLRELGYIERLKPGQFYCVGTRYDKKINSLSNDCLINSESICSTSEKGE